MKKRYLLLIFTVALLHTASALLADEVFSIKDVDKPPVPKKQVAPVLDPSGPQQGFVKLEFVVNEDGNVNSVSVLDSSDMALENPCMQAIRKWKFKPAKKDGSNVAVKVAIPFRFK